MKKIVLASNNAGKLRELNTLLENYNLVVIPQSELHVDEVEETGLTFIENALIKARHAARITGLAAIADDSGLVIDALKGAPGIYSSRYAGEPGNNQKNMTKLLSELVNIPFAERKGHFHCTLIYLEHAEDPSPLICEGDWYGYILTEPRGTHGFGYDPIFYVPTHEKSAAELNINEKNKISHRGQAMQVLTKKLANLFPIDEYRVRREVK